MSCFDKLDECMICFDYKVGETNCNSHLLIASSWVANVIPQKRRHSKSKRRNSKIWKATLRNVIITVRRGLILV